MIRPLQTKLTAVSNTPPNTAESREAFGIALRIASTLAFALMAVCIKALGDDIPLGQVVFFRSALALIPLVGFLWWCGDLRHGLSTHRPLGHIIRCLAGATAMFTSFATLRLLPLAEANMLSYLSPVLLALMGWVFLHEGFGLRRAVAVLLGLAGGVALVVPAFGGDLPEGSELGVMTGLVTALLTAIALLQVRRLTQAGEKAGAIAFWFTVVSALSGLCTAIFGWSCPTAGQWGLLIGAGMSGGIAHILMTLSFRHAEASALAPFEYLSVLWSVLLGGVLFSEIPSWSFLFACPLIVASAVIASVSKR
ncbi:MULTISPECIES: DMT family transporter [Aeromonas]|uniref:DMT family transporter n=1 Tax=Aeromonas TaxID=642 RepID=UPI00068EB97A|nr:DMT family transporter [Aeromonas caviae]